MAEKRPDTIGVFLGLITKEGKLRLQMRTESTSITGISYKGDFELPGGAVKEKDLRKVLTFDGLYNEAVRRVEEDLGLVVSLSFILKGFYLTVYENPKNGKIDWAFMIPVIDWDQKAKMKRKTVDVNPDQLNVLGELDLIVSGKKRMWRMSQAAIYMVNLFHVGLYDDQDKFFRRAEELLTETKTDWKQTELFNSADHALKEILSGLGL
ncbi:MAG: hypothetical protein HYW69_01035 [Candidatus Nealsonbacteria bacterium]|nr:hypothetical protein [Candidatus Nealsonbacteria bacterium]